MARPRAAFCLASSPAVDCHGGVRRVARGVHVPRVVPAPVCVLRHMRAEELDVLRGEEAGDVFRVGEPDYQGRDGEVGGEGGCEEEGGEGDEGQRAR